tara:strand:- start:33 stop:2834 length:2802 start_codon:yes stop_codon:yes gene_type:complete
LITSLLSSLHLKEYLSFDLETTGLNHSKDKITEIALCRFRDGEIVDQYTTLINPGISIPANIVEITGITDDMVSDAPYIGDILSDIIDFIGDTPLVGHNIDFDFLFINQSCSENNITFPKVSMYDTLSLARISIYFHNSFSLTSLCAYYKIDIEGAHRARADANATGILFKFLLQEIASYPIKTIQSIVAILNNSNEVYNRKLFKDILKASIRLNEIDGIVKSFSIYLPPNNIFITKYKSKTHDLPDTPLDWFIANGAIQKKFKGYEHRSSQLDFIKDVYDGFMKNYILLAEGGTGLGKSLAYLSSAFLAIKKKKSSLVVSTHTKTLQEQIFNQDIPQLSQSLNININAVIYKGRHNYICQTRLENLISNHHLLKGQEYYALLALIIWESKTKTGDINECNGFQKEIFKRLWMLVRSDKGYCTSARCQKYNGCYYKSLRKKVKKADIIIVNHSLLANELKREGTCFPEDFYYIIDEAHNFHDVIRNQLLKEFGINTLNDIYKYYTINKNNWKISIIKKHPKVYKIFKELSDKSNMLKQDIDKFFSSYVTCKNINNKKTEYNINNYLYKNSEEEFIETDPDPWYILKTIKNLKNDTEKYIDHVLELQDQLPKSIILELEIIKACLEEAVTNLQIVLKSDGENVCWSSITKGQYQYLTKLNAAPLRVDKFINDYLLDVYSGGLFCSATITINEEFSYFSQKIGIDIAKINNHIEEKIYPSPFYYNDQVKLFIFNSRIDVSDSKYFDEIAQQIDKLSITLKRRILVLCTSYKQIKELNIRLAPAMNKGLRNLIVQKKGLSRNLLISNYLEKDQSTLIGTSSFWEGIDLPGDKVEILCIVKTPFDNPFDPLVQSNIEDYSQHGQNAFLDYQVPEATMKLRQGFGRLIRNMNDSGICIIMDTRLSYRKYGKTILDSLPIEAIPYKHIDKVIFDAQKFF